MTLGDFEITPGVIVSNDDPLNQGRVKACAPGLFDTSTMNTDELMWISPFSMTGYQQFSKLEIGSKIWILHNVKNYFEYWYFPKFEINSNSPSVAGTDSDVILSRSINGENVQVYYSREDGFNIICGNSKLVQDNTGKFYVNNGKASIECSETEGIVLHNTDNTVEPAVLGNSLCNVIKKFCAAISSAGYVNSQNPYTCLLAQQLSDAADALGQEIDNILAKDVKIS